VQRPLADIEVTIDLARELLRRQHPDLADLELSFFDEGWDNVMFRLGPLMIMRMPRRLLAVQLVLNEQRWLSSLAQNTTMAIPAPLRIGAPSEQFNYPWSIVPWIEGVPGDRVVDFDQAGCATQLGTFLRELHHDAPKDAPFNAFRGVPLVTRTNTFRERCAMVENVFDLSVIREKFEIAVNEDPWAQPLRWIHGDLHPGNAIFHDRQMVGVIDFGDMCAGDPATDLAGAWMLLEPEALERCFDAYGGVDDALRVRARGWAAIFGVMFLSIGVGGHSHYQRVGERTLQRVAQT
jgi:aminoglycoside phosphotransferase (APT) family kinase protein